MGELYVPAGLPMLPLPRLALWLRSNSQHCPFINAEIRPPPYTDWGHSLVLHLRQWNVLHRLWPILLFWSLSCRHCCCLNIPWLALPPRIFISTAWPGSLVWNTYVLIARSGYRNCTRRINMDVPVFSWGYSPTRETYSCSNDTFHTFVVPNCGHVEYCIYLHERPTVY